MSDKNLKMDNENLLTPSRRSAIPPTNTEISNSTTKKFSNVVAQYMRVHKISSLNPAVVTKAADHTGLQGDSYHQWDQYNPPTPTAYSRVQETLLSTENLSNVETPSLDAYQFDNWSVGDNIPNAASSSKVQINNDNPKFTTTSVIVENAEFTPTSVKAGTSDITPIQIIKENSVDMELLSRKTRGTADATGNPREQTPGIPFLPGKHHLQLPIKSSSKSHTSMTSFWNDYERTTNRAENDDSAHTPMRYLNFSGSQNPSTPGSGFSNSAFESQIDTVMEPDSLEKKPISPAQPLTILASKKDKNSFAKSSTVASCLPHLLMEEYTESPPYMPSESFRYDMESGATKQRADINNNNDCEINSMRLRTNVQQSVECTSDNRNSFYGSSQNASVTHRNVTSDQPIITNPPSWVLDSLANEIEEKEKNRRWIVIAIFLMFIGALIFMIGLAILVYTQNKKFAPYNGIYPNGCRDVVLIEGAMHSHGVNCTEYLAQQKTDKIVM